MWGNKICTCQEYHVLIHQDNVRIVICLGLNTASITEIKYIKSCQCLFFGVVLPNIRNRTLMRHHICAAVCLTAIFEGLFENWEGLFTLSVPL